jgi:endoglucanase
MLLLFAALLVPTDDSLVIRVNQVGYLPSAPKVAVACALSNAELRTFTVIDVGGTRVLGPLAARAEGEFGPCRRTFRLDFSRLTKTGDYLVVAGGRSSPVVHIGENVYRGAADTLLHYLREQRSGWNPLFRDSVHRRDGKLVDHPDSNTFVPVSGGWADAADYLQYVTTSATATFSLLQAYRDHPQAFADAYDARGLPGANGLADVLDEARWGLEWLLRMFPRNDLMLNQLGDDRDHSFWDLPVNDSSDYGWGKGSYRAVYPCTGKPQGLFNYRNRSTGYASTAGKYAAAFALGAQLLRDSDPQFAERMRERATSAYRVGVENQGVCQTAPGRAAYFYEEENWVDDMELGAAQLFALTAQPEYIQLAFGFAAREPVTPWMGRDTARHYEFFPWHNAGHYEIFRRADSTGRTQMIDYYRRGLEAVSARATNGFRVGIPFIWCSNDLMVSFATQALLYRRMSGDARFREHEQAALDWIFGTNPWGVSMVIGFPRGGRSPLSPHSVIADLMGVQTQLGGLVDGPVYRSIFQNLKYVGLRDPDEFAEFNTGFIVYHDDLGDYSTNEPIMDGTANLVYLLSALAPRKP